MASGRISAGNPTRRKHGIQPLGQHIDRPGASQHPDCHKNRNQVGNDANRHLKSALGSFHEALIDLYFLQGAINRDTPTRNNGIAQIDSVPIMCWIMTISL